jgi:gamma-glutamylcyclotransferase (GGCT)/AIG2-like uncharacterized protein YtfP
MPLLFSYGTLQQESVQLATFGRRLRGDRDELRGYECLLIPVADPALVNEHGMTHTATVSFTGGDANSVSGTAFELTDEELARSDEYEAPFDYDRMSVTLASGRTAWVYRHARSARERIGGG